MSRQQIAKALAYVEKQIDIIEDAKHRLVRLKKKVISMARNYNNASGSTSRRTERLVRRRLNNNNNNNNNNDTHVKRYRRRYP